MLVSIVGNASAQLAAHGESEVQIVGDPTPESPTFCGWHILPPTSGRIEGSAADPESVLGWLYDTNPLHPYYNYASWLYDPTLLAWIPDRRPMMTVQLSSAGWGQNPHGNVEYWWIPHYYTDQGGKTRIYDDAPEDNRSPNVPELGGTFSSDKLWLVDQSNEYLNAPNGVPDQFDALIRTIRRWREFGIRRVMLHLPAGVNGGQYLGYAANHPGDDNYRIYGGTNQSMNQFAGMPSWKQDYFKGVGGANAWTTFLQTYGPGSADPMDIEVYVGGGLPQNIFDLGTEPTTNLTSTAPEDQFSGFSSTWTSRDVRTGYMGLNEFHQEVRSPVWREWYSESTPPYPIDPRLQFQVWSTHWNNFVNVPGNLDQVYWQLSPWFDVGIKHIWLDAASDNTYATLANGGHHERRWGSLELAHNPWIRAHNIKIGGETIPTLGFTSGNQVTEVLDDCAVANMPWFANFEVVAYEDNEVTHHRTWKDYAQTTLDRDHTEVHLLDNTGHMEWIDFRFAREHGYVVGAWNAYGTNPKGAEMMKRWYNLAKIKMADFNGDGVMNDGSNVNVPNDYEMAHQAVERSKSYALANGHQIFPRVFGNGDFDNNGQINDDDWTYFQSIWSQHQSGNDVVRDYQLPENHAIHDF